MLLKIYHGVLQTESTFFFMCCNVLLNNSKSLLFAACSFSETNFRFLLFWMIEDSVRNSVSFMRVFD